MTSNRLPVLQDEIRTAHAAAIAAAQTAVDRARDAGIKLIEAKSLLRHGQWLPWLKETGVSSRTAQDYMQLAKLPADKYATVAHLGVRKALAEIASNRAERGQIDHRDEEMERFLAFFESRPRHIQDEFLFRILAPRVVDPRDRGTTLPEGCWTPELKMLKERFWGREEPSLGNH
jgi:hypothetical protein